MITEQDLEQAIAECQGERNPNANTCIKLAAFYTILREMYGTPEHLPTGSYSFAESPAKPVDTHTIAYTSDTDFSRMIHGRDPDEIWAVMDELMTTLQIVLPRLYDGVMRKLQE